MHPKPSELGSQAGVGLPSTTEGDHVGTTGVVSFLHFFIVKSIYRTYNAHLFNKILSEGDHVRTMGDKILLEGTIWE